MVYIPTFLQYCHTLSTIKSTWLTFTHQYLYLRLYQLYKLSCLSQGTIRLTYTGRYGVIPLCKRIGYSMALDSFGAFKKVAWAAFKTHNGASRELRPNPPPVSWFRDRAALSVTGPWYSCRGYSSENKMVFLHLDKLLKYRKKNSASYFLRHVVSSLPLYIAYVNNTLILR